MTKKARTKTTQAAQWKWTQVCVGQTFWVFSTNSVLRMKLSETETLVSQAWESALWFFFPREKGTDCLFSLNWTPAKDLKNTLAYWSGKIVGVTYRFFGEWLLTKAWMTQRELGDWMTTNTPCSPWSLCVSPRYLGSSGRIFSSQQWLLFI